MSQAILEMREINKTFGMVPVLKDVNFSLAQGEIHALVGGNGAGKSTLMKIMTGVYNADQGEVFIEGVKKSILSTKDANENGIAMIFQELSLVQSMTVAENIFLGDELKKGLFRDEAAMNKQATEILTELGLSIHPNMPVNQLSVGMSQMVEIAKAISKNARILVLDEPTASLSETETTQLFKIINGLKQKNVSMVYISHRMNEILNIADTITILKDGKVVESDAISNMDLDKIISHISGGGASKNKFSWIERTYDVGGKDLLRVEHLKINKKINDISFSIKKGEILGLAGLMGSGRTEILETLFGMRKALSGAIYLDEKLLKMNSTLDGIKAGFALVPEDRRKQGLIMGHSVKENTILPMINKLLKKKVFVDEKAANALVNQSVSQLNVVTSSIHKTIRLLSGGNQQKVVLAKWLNMKPRIMMLDEPTAGVDIGAKSEIIEIVRSFADAGNGVIFVSSELTELMAVCDRIITIFDGRITGDISRKEINTEEDLHRAIQHK